MLWTWGRPGLYRLFDKTTKQSSLFKRIFSIQEKTSHHDLKKYENLWTGLSTESLVTEGWFSERAGKH